MEQDFVLASGSQIRAKLLENAGLAFSVERPDLDESEVQKRGISPQEIATALAKAKACKVAQIRPEALVLGCDQVAAIGENVLTKPASQDDACAQLAQLSGRVHHLYSAAVLVENGTPVWRAVGVVKMRMHALSPEFIRAYVARNWRSIRHAVGCYKLEEEGVRLFSAVEGDYFHVLGLPLIELLSYLTERGDLEI